MNEAIANPTAAFIGFGEAGQALAGGLREAGVTGVAAWDVLFPQSAGATLVRAAETLGVRAASSPADAIKDADLVFCAVTASSSLAAAASVKPHLTDGQFFLDINSVSPARKREVGEAMVGHGRYTDVAVMAPVHPARHRTPMLLAGPFAPALAPMMQRIAMRVSIAGPEIGMAAAIKMIRSVMVKGLEALSLECFVAAHRAGVSDQIFASLQESFPGLDWRGQVQYNIERMDRHGVRRAAEMREVAKTLEELMLDPAVTRGTITRQQRMGDLNLPHPLDGKARDAVAETLRLVSEALGSDKTAVEAPSPRAEGEAIQPKILDRAGSASSR
jgi:3-hydroxyisobutyrate dehydrogenase-like beta-hydroxyacid dehydrogenase